MKKIQVLIVGLILLSCGIVVEGSQIIKRGKMMKPENKKTAPIVDQYAPQMRFTTSTPLPFCHCCHFTQRV